MIRKLLLASFALLLLTASARGQATGKIIGTVTDPSGGVVPGAKIRVTQVGTGVAQSGTADSGGYYVVPFLPPAVYELAVEVSGFQRYVQEGITLQANQTAMVNVKLQVGATTQTVTVKAVAELVSTATATLSQVVDQQRMVELPLDGRNAAALTTLVAGAVFSPDGGADQGNQKTFPGAVTISTNGSRQNTINYQLDGADFNDLYTNVNAPFPFPDALQEFSVQTTNYTAQFGENAGAQVNVVTKSGTNQLHGDGFEFARNAVFNARNFFAKNRDQLKRNQFGGTVGGPVVIPGIYNGKDKTFFFFGYQGTRIRNIAGGANAVVPTNAEINGDFSALLDKNSPDNPFPGQVTPIIDPQTGQPFPGNQILTSRFDAAAVGLLKFLPRAGGTGRVFFSRPGIAQDFNEYVTREDHSFNGNRDRLTGRFTFNKFTNAGFFDPTNILTAGTGSKIEATNAMVHEMHVFRPNLLNDFRFSYFRDSSERGSPPNVPNAVDFGVKNVFQPTPKAVPVVNLFFGFFGIGTAPQAKFIRNSYTWADDVTLIKGPHHITFGGQFERALVDIRNQFRQNAEFDFFTFPTNFTVASFLLGKLFIFQQGAGEFKENSNNFIAFYAQDDYHVSRRLTLNLGMRYEPAWPWKEKKNRVELFRPEDALKGIKSQVFANAPPGVFFVGDTGVPSRGTTGDFDNVSPRFGFAYDVFGDGRTSLRGGAGLFYDSRQEGIINNRFVDVTPFSPQAFVFLPAGPFSDPTLGKGSPFPAPFPPPRDAPFPLPLQVISYDAGQGLRIPLTYNWNLTVEHQFRGEWLSRVAYVGSRSNYIRESVQMNPARFIPGSSLGIDQRRVFAAQGFGDVEINGQDINSRYNALQVTVEKRFGQSGPSWIHGLTVLGNYTYSKSLDDLPIGGGVNDIGASSPSELPFGSPFRHQFDSGRSDFDIKHRFVLSYVWQLPRLKGENKYVRNLLGNWDVTGILTAQSGGPVTVFAGTNTSQTDRTLERGVLLAPFNGNDTGKGPGACRKAAPCVDFLDPKSFGLPAIGDFGNVGKGFISGPNFTTLDMGLFKNIPLGSDRYRLQFRAEFFNIFNRVNLGGPNVSVASGGFGQILSASSPRIGQLALKIFF